MRRILEEQDIKRIITRIAHEIIERNKGIKHLALIGIKRRGDLIARRIVARIKDSEGTRIPMGALDITLYRDDLQLASETPIIEATDIAFDVSDMVVVLVDDVLYTGRTIRAAIEEILDFGRPRAIQLAVLVDRGNRELPIQADYVGKKIPTLKPDIIDVHIKELDGEDLVFIHRQTRPKPLKVKKGRIKMVKTAKPKVEQLTITGKI